MNDLFIKEIWIPDEAKDKGCECYALELPAIARMDPIKFTKPVTFFIGENGSGKSTLIEGVAVKFGFNPEGGTKNFNFSSEDTHSNFYHYLKLAKMHIPKDGFFLRAESFYNVASELNRLNDMVPGGFLDLYGGRSLHEQSHGESFMSLISNRFKGKGLYILDEPEAALSPMRQLSLLYEIDRLVKSRSQLIIATHSPILMAYPNAEIYMLDENGMTKQAYQETEHYQITKSFLDNPERYLSHLFS